MSVMLRPLTLGELLDRAFQLYRSHFKLFAGIAAIAYIPLFVMRTAILWLPRLTSMPVIAATAVGYLVFMVMALLGFAAATSATIMAVSATYLDRPITLREAYGRVSGILLRVCGMMMAIGIAVTFGLVFLIVPGVILGLMWALAIPVAVLENAGFSDSLARSRDLTAGHRMRVFAIFLLYYALIMALDAAILAPIGVVLAIKHGPAGMLSVAPAIAVASAIGNYVIEVLVTPVITICLSIMYYDERVRKEAFDIHLMMTALGDSPAPAAASVS